MMRKASYDHSLLGVVLLLLGFGLVMVFSASTIISQELYGSPVMIFGKQALAALIGLVLLWVTTKTDYRHYLHPGVAWTLVLITILLLLLALVAPASHGARRWISLGFMNFQPSELAKIAAVVFTARFVVLRGGEVRRIDRQALLYMAVLGVIILLILAAPDLGTAAGVTVTTACLLFVAGLRYRYYLLAGLFIIPAFYFLVLPVPYRRSRILAFLDPTADPYGAGYQILQSLIAVGSGGLTGMGFAQGTQKLFFLPELHSDFIFALIGQELGLIGATALVVLFGIFFWRGIRIALRAGTLHGTLLGVGLVVMIVFQAFFNISVVISLLPTKGIPLPFISAGGSSLIMSLAAVGILLNLSKSDRPKRAIPWTQTGPLQKAEDVWSA